MPLEDDLRVLRREICELLELLAEAERRLRERVADYDRDLVFAQWRQRLERERAGSRGLLAVSLAMRPENERRDRDPAYWRELLPAAELTVTQLATMQAWILNVGLDNARELLSDDVPPPGDAWGRFREQFDEAKRESRWRPTVVGGARPRARFRCRPTRRFVVPRERLAFTGSAKPVTARGRAAKAAKAVKLDGGDWTGAEASNIGAARWGAAIARRPRPAAGGASPDWVGPGTCVRRVGSPA